MVWRWGSDAFRSAKKKIASSNRVCRQIIVARETYTRKVPKSHNVIVLDMAHGNKA